MNTSLTMNDSRAIPDHDATANPGRSQRSADPGRSQRGGQLSGLRGELTAVITGGVMPIMDSTIVAIGMPNLIAAFHSNAATMQWVSTGYLLGLAVTVPIMGWLQARLGGRSLWIAGLVVFLAGSVACALSWNEISLIAFRVGQGMAAGMLMTLMQTLPVQEARRHGIEQIGSLISVISVPVATGPILGPVLGGLVLHWGSWHWLFLINVPIGLVAIVFALLWMPRDGGTPEGTTPRQSFDPLGFVLVSGGLVAILLALTNVATDGGFGHRSVLLPLGLGVVMLAAFLAEPRTRDPRRALIDISLMRYRSVASGAASYFLAGGAMYAAQFLLPMFWQQLRGHSVLAAALLLVPQGIGSLLSRLVAGPLADRIGSRTVATAGFFLVALMTLPFAFVSASTSDALLSGLLFFRGLALGILFIPGMLAAYLDIPASAVANATIITRVAQQVGASFGTAVVAVVLEASLRTGGVDGSGAFHQAFWATIAITVAGGVVALWLPGRQGLPGREGLPATQEPPGKQGSPEGQGSPGKQGSPEDRALRDGQDLLDGHAAPGGPEPSGHLQPPDEPGSSDR